VVAGTRLDHRAIDASRGGAKGIIDLSRRPAYETVTNAARNERASGVSTRVTGTAVLQFPRTAFVTPIVVTEPGSKCGLPESPKQGPPRPVAASFARTENVDR